MGRGALHGGPETAWKPAAHALAAAGCCPTLGPAANAPEAFLFVMSASPRKRPGYCVAAK
jgi:hypothetical protein